ncbi:MAG: phenylacetaldoxime dehydratase family protein [Rhodospirillaceae bacterium]|nr:phenylacetaldoxime dehydratase family protein [Rhodospirillaceae bacterium]
MRDRIPLSGSEALRNPEGLERRIPAKAECDGKRVVVVPPQDMCVIRSGQNWSLCDDHEKSWYLKKMHPVLLDGMRFLSDHPDETNCYSLRFVTKTDEAWQPVEQSFGLGYAADVYAFEEWAKSHPTHLAIFARFQQMVDEFGDAMKLRLWHEVTALPANGCEFEYLACHPETGLLGYV